ncbi:MAG: OmpA family protein [Chitinophagales bacterium]
MKIVVTIFISLQLLAGLDRIIAQNSLFEKNAIEFNNIDFSDPQVGQFFIPRAIFFTLGRDSIRTESWPCLDTIAIILSKAPGCIFEVSYHSDYRQSEECCNNITGRRADKLKNYFVENYGIDTARLISKGYGDKMPYVVTYDILLPDSGIVRTGTVLNEEFISKYKSNIENWEFLLQLDRRVEFKIIGFTEPYNSFKNLMGYCDVDFTNPQVGQYWIDNVTFFQGFHPHRNFNPHLDSLTLLLEFYPDYIFEIGLNTDSRDTEERNLLISERRAFAFRDSIIIRGADSSHLIAKGYGESNPRILEYDVVLPSGEIVARGTVLTEGFILAHKMRNYDFETLHQLNRRITFTIVGKK